MKRISCLFLVAVSSAFVIPVTVLGQVPPKVTFIASMNEYNPNPDANLYYNDCWGYTAPDGREYALLGVHSGTSIVDITDAPTLNEVAFIPNHRNDPSLWKDIKTYRHYAYVVTESGVSGLQVIDLSNLPVSATLVKTDTSVFRPSHNLYIDTTRGLLYAEGDGSAPVRLWSLADPANPQFVSSFGPASQQVHDIYARGNRAYLSEGSSSSFAIYDVTNPATPLLLKRFYTPSAGYAHNAWLSDDGNYLMTTEETVGRTVKMWNISDLESIQLVGQYLGTNQLAHNTHIKGHFAYISHYKSGLRIVDIQDPALPVEVASYNTYSGAFGDSYHGAWGAYPFFPSGRILISDMERGLYVVSFDGDPSTSVQEGPAAPEGFSLYQNFPNPFNPSTSIVYSLPAPSPVRLTVVDLLGRELDVLAGGTRQAGQHTVEWHAGSKPSGVYLVVLTTSFGQQTRRMVLAR